MKALSTDEIRRAFLDFFKKRGHEEVASSSLVPAKDPTLLFTNAGMVQFKDVFTGKETRRYTRATTAQKCVRAGGKHNDLENVGYTTRHHTFFEMLGNFSFGDYFKEEAIVYAWELITKVLGLPLERLCVTVFCGDHEIPADEEAAALWAKVGVPKARILRLGRKDNYWQMGDTGPQGPCSEIHYFNEDDTQDMFQAGRVEASDGWLEIWNLVFMQFEREAKESELKKLPKPSVDTGAGLERLAMILQGVRSNYETDTFEKILKRIAEDAKKPYPGTDGRDNVSMRVIADHARATAFLLSDGVAPSNEGRGYVLRRIMRRAIRHGTRLGFDELFFDRACTHATDVMSGAYPELKDALPSIKKWTQNEETAFRRTLQRGLKRLSEEMKNVKKDGALDPGFVAKLWDTYGFPIDLTRVIANENGVRVDEEAAQKAKSALQKSSAEPTRPGTEQPTLWQEASAPIKNGAFTGYETDENEAIVRGLAKKGCFVDQAVAGDEVEVALDQTPFYGESGGQVGDIGVLSWPEGQAEVLATKKPLKNLNVHRAKITKGQLGVGTRVLAGVDGKRRDAVRRNHSATHLLHLALKEILGSHVTQKGSLVAPDRLRFDYAHFASISVEDIRRLENRVNELILKNDKTQVEETDIETARTKGAMMLFDEKYGERVRTVRVGAESLELCGGTHVARAGDIGLFKIVSDAPLASGIRRLEAVTGLGALAWVQKQESILQDAASALKISSSALTDRVRKLVEQNRELERKLDALHTQAAMGAQDRNPMDQVERWNGVQVLVHRADGTPKKALRQLADRLRDKLQSGVVILTACSEGHAAILVAATKDLREQVHAGQVVKAVSQAMGGSGGGRPDFAQGGGKATKLDAGLRAARQAIEQKTDTGPARN